MRTEGNIARILHHVGQEIAEDRILQRIKVDVALPHFATRPSSRCAKASSTSLRSSVATSFICLRPMIARVTLASEPAFTVSLGYILASVASMNHFLRDATHFGDAARNRVEFPVVGLDGMFDHCPHSPSRTGR
jgi:hypothetical protein